MTTGLDIVKLALEAAGHLGEGQILGPGDESRALKQLNMMLGQWSRRRWLVYHLVDTGITATGAESYTVGSGGSFDIARPDRLEGAYARLNADTDNPVDYWCGLLEAREDYSKIGLKSLASFPSWAFYDSDYPTGNVYFWPIPDSAYEIHILTKEVLSSLDNLAADLVLPPEYEEALWTNLAVRCGPVFQLDVGQDVKNLAKAALQTIRASNFQIARLAVPSALARPSRYNIYSDQSY